MKKKFVKGMQGIIAAETSLGKIDGKKGTLVYKGYSIFDLAKYASYEEVVYLLWYNKLPKRSELNKFRKLLTKHMKLPTQIKKFIQKLPRDVIPMTALRTSISLLAIYDKDAEDISMKANERKALRIMAAMPTIITAIQRVKEGKNILNPKKNLSLAANFLYMLHGKVPNKEEEEKFNVCIILHAEHGMNASTFSSRVTVSTLSDMHSGIVSALGTLKGPLHGGANKRAIQSLHYLGDQLELGDVCDINCLEEVDKYVINLLKKHQRIMGIGHRVYKVKDPRAVILEKYASKVGKKQIKYYQMAKEIEKMMKEKKKLYPNVDFFSGIVYESIGIKPSLYVCIFALARTAGWLAHIMEQYKDNRLIRPASIYKGALKKKYIKLEKR